MTPRAWMLAGLRGRLARPGAIPGGRVRPIPVERSVVAAALVVGAALWWPVLAPPVARGPATPRVSWTRDLVLARLAERPLFNPARRFPPEPVAPNERPVDAAARSLAATHHFKGVARTQDDAIVFIENRETRQIAVLRVGGVVEGFAVTGIRPGEVVLKGPDGGSVTLSRSDP